MAKNKPKRTRNKEIHLMFTEEEYNFFKEKFAKSKMGNYSDFVLRAVSGVPLIDCDITPFLDMSEQIWYIGNNINQIAKIANTTGCLYENDVKELKEKVEKLDDIISQSLNNIGNVKSDKIVRGIIKARSKNLNGIHKDSTD